MLHSDNSLFNWPQSGLNEHHCVHLHLVAYISLVVSCCRSQCCWHYQGSKKTSHVSIPIDIYGQSLHHSSGDDPSAWNRNHQLQRYKGGYFFILQPAKTLALLCYEVSETIPSPGETALGSASKSRSHLSKSGECWLISVLLPEGIYDGTLIKNLSPKPSHRSAVNQSPLRIFPTCHRRYLMWSHQVYSS